MKSSVHTGERILRLVEKFPYAAGARLGRSLCRPWPAFPAIPREQISFRGNGTQSRVFRSPAGSLKVRRCDTDRERERGRERASREGCRVAAVKSRRVAAGVAWRGMAWHGQHVHSRVPSLWFPFCLFRVIRIARRNRGSAITSAIKLVATRNVHRFSVPARICMCMCACVCERERQKRTDKERKDRDETRGW